MSSQKLICLMFTSINHFKISLFLRTFSVFKLSVKYGNVSSGFSNRFLVQQPFQHVRMLRSYIYLNFLFYLEKFSKGISFNERTSPVLLRIMHTVNKIENFCFYCTQEMSLFFNQSIFNVLLQPC